MSEQVKYKLFIRGARMNSEESGVTSMDKVMAISLVLAMPDEQVAALLANAGTEAMSSGPGWAAVEHPGHAG